MTLGHRLRIFSWLWVATFGYIIPFVAAAVFNDPTYLWGWWVGVGAFIQSLREK